MQGTNTTPSNFSFGQLQTAPVQSTSKSMFSTTTSTSGGLSFGSMTSSGGTQQAAAPGGIFGFGTGGTTAFPMGQPAATTTASTGFNLGTNPTATTTTSGFSFGTTPATTTTSSGFSFLGTPSQVPASTAPTTAGFSFGSVPASSSSGFSFGLPGATTSAPSTGITFSTGGGLGGVQISKPTGFGFTAGTGTAPSLTATTTTTTTAGTLGGVGIGLGGVQPPSANADASNSGSKTNGKSTKDQQLPPDLFATIALFESRKTAENAASEENIRQIAGPFHKVGDKAKEIQKILAELASEYLQLQASATNLKAEVMKEAEHVEMARRTKDTPMALQGDNKAPEMFFINLVRSFEAEMMYCRTKIEEVSQCMQAANSPCETEEDIAEVLQREHDTLKDLAAKVYLKHSQLVELSQLFKTKTAPNEQAFFRPQSKEDAKTPASSVVRPILGSGSGLQAFQEQQQRAKAVTLGAAPPTMPLAHTTTPSMFSNPNPSSIYSTGGTTFGTNSFNFVNSTGNTTFGAKPLFGNTSSTFGTGSAFGANTTGVQQTTNPFPLSSPFNSKPFGAEEDGEARRKRRL